MSERRARDRIIAGWRAAGCPVCPVCATAIEDDAFRISHLWQAVVHPFCVQARILRPSQMRLEQGACGFYPHCPIPFHHGGSCACPSAAAVNLIILARRLGRRTVAILTSSSYAAINAARRAGLGQHYRGVPLREDPRLDDLRNHGVLVPDVDEAFWHRPADWWTPPRYVTVDVDLTIRQGRVCLTR